MRGFVSDFLDTLLAEKGVLPNTISAYSVDLQQFFDFIKDGKFSSENVENFFLHLSNKGMSSKTINRKITSINSFCKFLISEKIISNNPCANLIRPKEEKKLPRFLSKTEAKNLIGVVAKNPHHQRTIAMCKLMYVCGLRVSELVSIKTENLNLNKKTLRINGKGAKERVVPISNKIISDIQKYLTKRLDFAGTNKKSPWLFPSPTSKSGHITRDGFFKNLSKLAIDAGISPSRISPHSLRHSFATHMLNNNADLRVVQTLLGHENIATTEIYTHILSEELINEVKNKHPLALKKQKS